MKAKFALLIFLFSALSSFAQTSDKGFSFQGFAIDPDGKALGATAITVQFTISPSVGTGGTYIETHTLVSDAYGVFNAIIGKGAKGAGSIEFKNLDYTRKGTIYKLKVDVKKTSGGIFTTISDADLNAVPYARKAENGVPVGTIVAFGGDKNNVPEGWLLCDGASISQADYPQLYAAIGSAWGSLGSSFNVPDLRGTFLRGVNDAKTGSYSDPDANSRATANQGGNSGNAVGTMQANEYYSHKHGLNDPSHSHPYNDFYFSSDGGSVAIAGGFGSGADTDNNNNGYQVGRTTSTANTGISMNNSGGNETRPNNASVYYIIKY